MTRLSTIPALLAPLALLAAASPQAAEPVAPARPPLKLDLDKLAPTTPAPVQPLPPAPAPAAPISWPPLTAAQRDAMRAFIDASVRQGLSESPPADTASQSDAALIARTLDLSRALHSGRLAAGDFITDWGMQPEPFDPAPGLLDALSHDKLAGWFAALPPPYAGYDGLRKGLARYRRIAAAGGWPTLSIDKSVVPGGSGPGVALLRRRLAVEDKDAPTTGDKYDADVVAAVRRAQNRYGLNPTGTVGNETLGALNVSAQDRVRQIEANLERWRWLPRQLPQHRVQVNIAAAVLTVFDGDQPVQSMRAVTGRPDDETPMLASSIHSVVLNPPWNVPQTIAAKELLPKERANPGYLKRNGFKVIKLDDGGTRLQQSSEKSALGHFKFDFDNRYAVYLHDTPTRATFSRYSRLASHGCVRLEKPADLAARLLADDPKWTPDAIADAVATGDTQRVRLPQPVAVYLFYWTAFASGDQMAFRADPYGWDQLLASKVEARGRQATEVAAR